MTPLPPNMRSARLVQLLEVEVMEGSGSSLDPCRIVTYLYRPEGEFVAKNDDVKPSTVREGQSAA